jgi:outer membrane scaffolding protein for murein synthesis (MipA/OmpV family)
MRNSMIAVVLLSLVFVGLPAVSSAAGDVKYSIGAGVGVVPDYEGSEDYTAAPVPYFSAQWKSGRYIRLDGNVLKINLLANDTWSLGPVMQYRAERDVDVDNNKVSKMDKIDAAVEAGAFLGYNYDTWDIGFQLATDVSGEHDGMLATARTGYTFKNDKMSTRFGASVTYADDDYMDTYFSVDKKDAIRSGLKRYKAESGIKDVGVDLTLRYSMTENWGIRGAVAYLILLEDAKDSPIVDDEGESGQIKASLVVMYNF